MLLNTNIKLIAGLVFCLPAFGQCTNPTCSVVIPSAFTSASIASGTIGSFRIEARLVGMNWMASTGSNEDVFNIGGFGVTYLGGSGQTNFIQFKSGDNTPGNIPCYVNLGGANPSDVSVRITRDLGTSTSTLEAFSTPTGELLGANCVFTITTVYPSSSIIAAGSYFGNPVAAVLGGNIAFIRWYSTLVPIKTAVPVAVVTPADLVDYEFDGTLVDTSGRSGQNFTGTVTYANTPVYNPSCSAGTQQSISGTTMNLSGANSLPLNGGTTLTYVWSYFTGSDGVNQAPAITGGTTVNPTVTGLNLFGSADFHLVVTDSTSNTSSCDIHNGVVKITGAAGVIDLTAEGVPATSQLIIGPLIKFGSNRWPWADTIHLQEANIQIANQTGYYSPYWETPLAGTISVSAGSSTITGTGTNFLAACNGGTMPLGQLATMILIYPGTDGLTHYLAGQNLGCTDATHMTFAMPKGGGYPTGTPGDVYPDCTVACTGWHWQWGYAQGQGDPLVAPQNQYGIWAYNTAPGNYYDNAKTFYGLYLRSGIDTYQLAFHHMADWWWEFPIMDQGYGCDPAGSSCWAPAAYRSMAMNGIYLRALEQGSGSPKWPGIWLVSQLAQSTLTNYAAFTFPVSIDGRETGYMMSILSYCALTDPNSGHRATCKANIQTNLSAVWTHFRRTDIGSASWLGLQYANQIPANQAISFTNNGAGGQGSACVVNGSSTVTGTGTVWDTNMVKFSLWFYTGTGPSNAPVDNTVGDPVGYGIVSVNAGAQTMTLTSAYAGTTGCTGTSGSNKGYLVGYFQGDATQPATASNGFMGWGILPYSQGMLGTSFGWAAKAMDDGGFDPSAATLYRQYMHETVTWLQNYALNPISGGLYSGTLFVGCIPPISTSNVGCFSGDISGARTLSLDVMRDLSMDYLQNGQPSATFTTADMLMSQMFSKPGTGGPNPDGNYIDQYDGFYTDPAFTPPVGQAPKWAGQLCGFEEACDMWPAARLSGSTSAGGGSGIGGGVRMKGIVVH